MPSPEIRKAAILLMSLPESEAAALMSRLTPRQAELVTIELARVGYVPAEEQLGTLNEFADANPNTFGGAQGGLEVAKALVEKALGKSGSTVLDSVRQQIEALPFGFLQKVDSQNLLTFIMDEHPQMIALVLSHLKPQQAAEVISGLPADRQLSVVRRIAHMGQTTPEIIREIEKGLEVRMSSVMSQQFEKAGGVESVAEILNVTDRATERALLENLAQEDPDLVDEIRRLMFVFEDIGKFGDKEIQTVLKNVETSQWALALKGASETLKQKVLGNLSQRAAELLKQEMEYLGPVRLSNVEQAQQQIVDVVRKLEDTGEITVNAGDEQEQFVS